MIKSLEDRNEALEISNQQLMDRLSQVMKSRNELDISLQEKRHHHSELEHAHRRLSLEVSRPANAFRSAESCDKKSILSELLIVDFISRALAAEKLLLVQQAPVAIPVQARKSQREEHVGRQRSYSVVRANHVTVGYFFYTDLQGSKIVTSDAELENIDRIDLIQAVKSYEEIVHEMQLVKWMFFFLTHIVRLVSNFTSVVKSPKNTYWSLSPFWMKTTS